MNKAKEKCGIPLSPSTNTYWKNQKERRERKNRKKIQRNIAKNLPNLMKNTNFHNQNSQQTPSRINTKISTLRHITAKNVKRQNQRESLKNHKRKMTDYIQGSHSKINS